MNKAIEKADSPFTALIATGLFVCLAAFAFGRIEYFEEKGGYTAESLAALDKLIDDSLREAESREVILQKPKVMTAVEQLAGIADVFNANDTEAVTVKTYEKEKHAIKIRSHWKREELAEWKIRKYNSIFEE